MIFSKIKLYKMYKYVHTFLCIYVIYSGRLSYYTFLSFYFYTFFFVKMFLSEIRISGTISTFLILLRIYRICTINTNGLANQISRNYSRFSLSFRNAVTS